MIRQWGHGHSLVFGLGVGLLLAERAFILALVCFLAGLTIGRGWAKIAELAGGLIRRLLSSELVFHAKPRGRRPL